MQPQPSSGGRLPHRPRSRRLETAEAVREYVRFLQIVPDQPEARRELARLGRAVGP
jgi:hypothetical protein